LHAARGSRAPFACGCRYDYQCCVQCAPPTLPPRERGAVLSWSGRIDYTGMKPDPGFTETEHMLVAARGCYDIFLYYLLYLGGLQLRLLWQYQSSARWNYIFRKQFCPQEGGVGGEKTKSVCSSSGSTLATGAPEPS